MLFSHLFTLRNKFDTNKDASNIREIERIFLNLLEFLANIAFFVNGLRTDGPTDGPTDGQTKPLIELFATKN